MTGKLTFQCVGCKTQKTLGTDALDKVSDLGVFCDRCYMPCVLHSGSLKSRRSKRDLREAFR